MQRRTLLLLAPLCALRPAVAEPGSAQAGLAEAEAQAALPAARLSATQWLALLDAGDMEASWSQSAAVFRMSVNAAQWAQAARGVRTPLGSVRQREERSARFTRTLPGAPDGAYVLLQYGTDFEHKAQAVETLTLAQDSDGTWRVAGYFVR